MTPEEIELAKKMAAHPKWVWEMGMRYTHSGNIWYRITVPSQHLSRPQLCVEDGQEGIEGWDTWMCAWVSSDMTPTCRKSWHREHGYAWPDLNDHATQDIIETLWERDLEFDADDNIIERDHDVMVIRTLEDWARYILILMDKFEIRPLFPDLPIKQLHY